MICDFKFSSGINHQLIVRYGEFLFSKLNAAELLDFHDVLISGEKPKRRECHKNAQCFCVENPSYQLERGWLVFDGRPAFNSIKFIAHSVVRRGDGKLLDVTPIESLDPRPFLPAFIDNEEFEEFADWLYETNLEGAFNFQIK